MASADSLLIEKKLSFYSTFLVFSKLKLKESSKRPIYCLNIENKLLFIIDIENLRKRFTKSYLNE